MNLSLSVIVVLHEQETAVARIVRGALQTAREALGPDGSLELIAVDERSGDNTLSHLSILQHKLPELRVLEAPKRGRGIQVAARVARGKTWIIVDHNVDPKILRWGIESLRKGHRAAVVPGEVLVVDAKLGHGLSKLRGGLVAAERAVARVLEREGLKPAWGSGPRRGLKQRASLMLRRSVGQIGLSWLDRRLGI